MADQPSWRHGFLLELLADDERDPVVLLRRVCGLAKGLLGVSGAAVTMMSDRSAAGVICSSDATARALEDLQFTLNEGPGLHAFMNHGPALVPDLTESARWVAFTAGAIEAGAGAMFSFPLQLGAVKLGAMTLYRDRPGRLAPVELDRGVALAEVVTDLVLVMRSGGGAWDATIIDAFVDDWAVIHQATGMTSAQLGVDVGTALARLRAEAFSSGRNLGEVADDVVSRRLRLPFD